jgi:hypothetical protein
MAEIKNTFIKSRMNSDLDARLLSNNEYRTARNIAVSQSEGEGVGSLETVLGNVLLEDFLDSECNAKIIGHYCDNNQSNIYVFLTDYIDNSPSGIARQAPNTATCQIWVKNINTSQKTKLVEGSFLNFSLNSPITGINIIEDLLFWTDNRNQPRKINVKQANTTPASTPTYYTNEDQISVAKYYPLDPILLYQEYLIGYSIIDDGCDGCTGIDPSVYKQYAVDGDILPTTTNGDGTGMTVVIIQTTGSGEVEVIRIENTGMGYTDGDRVYIAPKAGSLEIELEMQVQSTMKDTCTELLPNSITIEAGNPTPATETVTSGSPFDVTSIIPSYYVGCKVKLLQGGVDVTPESGATLTAVAVTPTATVTWIGDPATQNVDDVVLAVNPDYNSNWPGDCEFLKDKFVRFAYRFKFDDNEYSLISPFTQPCFIPQQNGYFIDENEDQENAYNNTTLEFFQNLVTNVDLVIPCPKLLWNNLSDIDDIFSNLTEKMHVTDIEIIYKDDNELTYKIVDSISTNEFSQISGSTFIYSYQSTQPYRVLPESETTRISDSIPIRALAQEVTGNRIIYGNYVDKHSSLESLDYEVVATDKTNSNLQQEYQNHTLKQNRTYQVGVVFSDRYGRQSDVILSNPANENTIVGYSRDTVSNEYKEGGFSSSSDLISPTTPYGWFGDVLKIAWNNVVPSVSDTSGYPGLFNGYVYNPIQNLYGGTGYALGSYTDMATTGGSGSGLTVDYITDQNTKAGPSAIGQILQVSISDVGVGYQQYDLITISGGGVDATFIYNPEITSNILGWYGYKVVVKQQEQEYYNVYLPGIVNGLLSTAGAGSSNQATISLFGDNINKVPRDQTDLVPGQKTYTSTTDLVLRVDNVVNNNEQFYPGTHVERVVNLGELSDLGIPLDRYSQQSRAATALNAYLELEGYNEDIQPGMAVTSVSDTGVPKIVPSDGLYVQASYIDAASPGDGKITLNDAVPLSGTVGATDVIIFSPPGIIYNSGSNPLIGVLATNTTIGVEPDSNFTVNLSVAETDPVRSNLNIYWETSTAGLINGLNSNIVENADVGSFANISNIDINFSEATPSGTTISNSFYGLDYSNQPLIDPNATCQLLSVTDQSLQQVLRTSDFILTGSLGQFTIRTATDFYCGNDTGAYTFNFVIKMTINGIIHYKIVVAQVGNGDPYYTDSSGVQLLNPPSTTINNFMPAGGWSDNGLVASFWSKNGSISNSLDQQELTWRISSAKITQIENNPDPEFQGGSNSNDPDDYSFDAYDPCVNCSGTSLPWQLCVGKDVTGWYRLWPLAGPAPSPSTIYGSTVKFDPFLSSDSFTSNGLIKGAMLVSNINSPSQAITWTQTDGFVSGYGFFNFFDDYLIWGEDLITAPTGESYVSYPELCIDLQTTVQIEVIDGAGSVLTGLEYIINYKNTY